MLILGRPIAEFLPTVSGPMGRPILPFLRAWGGPLRMSDGLGQFLKWVDYSVIYNHLSLLENLYN